ncbi:Rab-GTPase-TBC domain [Cinara cedri]|uniref:Rab-GTPase-TBC domain n=1 Tax=Cinara cedri TaxID=506608 RepID=A0A5E4M697_9HEMI|nr:Rab-GTPase-TBC domain [Cinara cedri]
MFYAELDDSRENSVKIYEKEWKCLFSNTDIDELQELAIKGELRTSRFRSICWRRLLNILPSDSSNWLTIIQQSRSTYNRIKMKHHNDPHQEDSGPDDPLSQDDNSIWNQYFQDEGLKKIIEQDVVRTFPENQFFRAGPLQRTMVEILFCYSREHPDLCYRQGMHEILAPLIFVLFCDHQALLQVCGQLSPDVCDLIKDILNPAYLEEDTYLLFSTIMEIIKDDYNFNDYGISQLDHLGAVKTASNPTESQVVRKLYKIRDTILAKCDPELHQHLSNLDISFTTFGVRWLRLLFGGEFSLVDVLVLWDSIFAKSPQDFALVNYIFVAMLVILRIQLLKSDNTTCLGYLMRYPSIDVMDIILYALHMFAPTTYALPSAATFLKYQTGNDNLKTNNIVNQPERPSKFISSSSNYSARRMYNNSTDELIDVCKNRILQYHSVLSNAVPTHNKEAMQALKGMLELYAMLDNRPGVIEMGKDVARFTTPIQTPISPDTPEGGPLLPPPASAITMKVFSQSERSTHAQIQGAPTKNPLKQMKR